MLWLLVLLGCGSKNNCSNPTAYVDADGDGIGGARVEKCRLAGLVPIGGDCDDEDPLRSPALGERCDGRDNDCNGEVDDVSADALPLWFADEDQDGFGDPYAVVAQCTQPAGHVSNSSDCNDQNDTIHPGASELCDGIDEDCDLQIDDYASDSQIWYHDEDGDGYGDSESPFHACEPPDGYVDNDQDCDDGNSDAYPLGERCQCDDGIDNDKDGALDCDDSDCATLSTCIETHCGNGLDDDSDGLIDCEDGDCLASSRCYESSCTDKRDNDDDGLLDCFDEDCWGDSDCDGDVAEGWVNAGIVRTRRRLYLREFRYLPGHTIPNIMIDSFSMTMSAASLSGSVRFLSPSNGTTALCSWQLGATRRSYFSARLATSTAFRDVEASSGVTMSHTGFMLSAGCPFSRIASTFLPALLGAGNAIRWGVIATDFSDDLNCNAHWYTGTQLTSTGTTTAVFVRNSLISEFIFEETHDSLVSLQPGVGYIHGAPCWR